MKTVLVFLFVSVLVTSYGQQSCTLTGKVLSPEKSYIILYYKLTHGLDQHADTIPLDKEGDFKHIWKFDSPDVAAVLEVSSRLSLHLWGFDKGSLGLEIADSVKKTVFSGSLEKYNRYLSIQARVDKKKILARHAAVSDLPYGSDEYFGWQDTILSESIGMLNDHFADDKSNEAKYFIRYYADFISYANLDSKLLVGDPDAILKFKPFQKVFKINDPKFSYSFPAKIDIDSESFSIEQFHYFLRSYLFTSTFAVKGLTPKDKDVNWSWDNVYNNVFQTADRLYKPGTLTNSLIKASFINTEINLMHSQVYKEDTTEATYTKYVDRLLNDPLITKEAALVQKNLHQKLNTLGRLKKGTIAPASKLYDSEGKLISWENFKGKYIYIDVWASWCKPCIAEIPSWNELVEKFKDNKEVVFITISIDDNIQKWKNALTKYKSSGIHLISAGGFDSDFSRSFNIKSVPSNMLIDKEGKILQQRAPRPNEIALDEIISHVK